MEFKLQQVRPGFAESCSKMYILPTLTYLEVGAPAAASKIICFEHFKWEPISRAGSYVRLVWRLRTQCVANRQLPGGGTGNWLHTGGHFLIRRAKNRHLDSCYAPENFEHMAEKISLRYVEIRGLFGFRCT